MSLPVEFINSLLEQGNERDIFVYIEDKLHKCHYINKADITYLNSKEEFMRHVTGDNVLNDKMQRFRANYHTQVPDKRSHQYDSARTNAASNTENGGQHPNKSRSTNTEHMIGNFENKSLYNMNDPHNQSDSIYDENSRVSDFPDHSHNRNDGQKRSQFQIQSRSHQPGANLIDNQYNARNTMRQSDSPYNDSTFQSKHGEQKSIIRISDPGQNINDPHVQQQSNLDYPYTKSNMDSKGRPRNYSIEKINAETAYSGSRIDQNHNPRDSNNRYVTISDENNRKSAFRSLENERISANLGRDTLHYFDEPNRHASSVYDEELYEKDRRPSTNYQLGPQYDKGDPSSQPASMHDRHPSKSQSQEVHPSQVMYNERSRQLDYQYPESQQKYVNFNPDAMYYTSDFNSQKTSTYKDPNQTMSNLADSRGRFVKYIRNPLFDQNSQYENNFINPQDPSRKYMLESYQSNMDSNKPYQFSYLENNKQSTIKPVSDFTKLMTDPEYQRRDYYNQLHLINDERMRKSEFRFSDPKENISPPTIIRNTPNKNPMILKPDAKYIIHDIDRQTQSLYDENSRKSAEFILDQSYKLMDMSRDLKPIYKDENKPPIIQCLCPIKPGSIQYINNEPYVINCPNNTCCLSKKETGVNPEPKPSFTSSKFANDVNNEHYSPKYSKSVDLDGSKKNLNKDTSDPSKVSNSIAINIEVQPDKCCSTGHNPFIKQTNLLTKNALIKYDAGNTPTSNCLCSTNGAKRCDFGVDQCLSNLEKYFSINH